MNSRTGMRLLGLAMIVLGVAGTIWMWHEVRTRRVYWPFGSLLMPLAACLGIATLCNPISRREAFERFGNSQLAWKDMTALQKILIVLGFSLGLLNWALISGTL